jgi:hypothetical protein
MARITIPAVTLRTTSDGTGYPLGVAAGTGPTAPLALAALSREAASMAEMAAGPFNDDADARYIEDGSGGLEVIDVRLMHGPADSQNDGWLAYGTLRTTGLSPLSPADEPFHGQ